MRTIAICVEGYAEAIFIHHIILILYKNINIIIDPLKFQNFKSDFYVHKYEGAEPLITFRIFIADGDNKLVSMLKNSSSSFFERYEKVICLRDIYCETYKNELKKRRFPPGVVNPTVTSLIENSILSEIAKIKQEKIDFHFAMMEIEAWFLAFYHLFPILSDKLNEKYISDELKMDITVDDLSSIFHPYESLARLFGNVGLKYDKTHGSIKNIVSTITSFSDLELSQKRLSRLSSFVRSIKEIEPKLHN